MKLDNWADYPMSDAVNWPTDEKIIGVLGVAPLATADLYQKLCARKVKKDWLYPRIIIDSNPKIPSRGRCLELGETDPTPYIRAGIESLVHMGAQIIVIPCNTAHIFYNKYAEGFSVDIPNIIEITSRACVRAGVKRPLILASRLTIKYSLYQQYLTPFCKRVLTPNANGQNFINSCIETVKQRGYDANLAAELREYISESDVDGVILGCTELPALVNDIGNSNNIAVIDSNREMAEYCLDAAKGVETQDREF